MEPPDLSLTHPFPLVHAPPTPVSGTTVWARGLAGQGLETGDVFVHRSAIVMDGFPLPPLENMPGADPAAAQKNATYYGQDMRFFIWWGADDPIFPAPLSMSTYNGIFAALGISDTLKVNHTEPGMSHTLIQSEFTQMVQFIKG